MGAAQSENQFAANYNMNAREAALNNAYNNANMFGGVSNADIAALLGVDVGTQTYAAQQQAKANEQTELANALQRAQSEISIYEKCVLTLAKP